MASGIAVACLLLCLPGRAFAQIEVGTHFPIDIDTPVNYPGAPVPGDPTVVWFHVLSHPGATYIAVHFVGFDLGPGDYLAVCDNEGGQEYVLSGKGKLGAGTFWARHVKGDTALLQLIAVSKAGGAGFKIDEYAAGDVSLGERPSMESVHGSDDRENAVCYEQSHPTMYARGRAVMRLLIGGSRLCTGSLVSPYNHALTNNHCIYNVTQALNTDFELMAEAPTCGSSNCRLCYPGVVFSGGTLLEADSALDYALVQINQGDPALTYGYLEFDDRAPVVGEQIYFPQHPDGRAKEFAIFSTHPADTGGVARIQSVTEDPCQGGSHQEVGYYADSEGGSSGSPIMAASSHKLIALHHCGGSINVGVPIDLIYPEIENHIFGFTSPGRIAPGSIAVAADSSQGGDGPAGAIDRDINTRWTSGGSGDEHWLRLDLGLQAPVVGFKVWHAGAAGDPSSGNTVAFQIESAGSPGGPWTVEFVGSNPSQEDVSSFEYASAKGLRHIQLYITDAGSDDVARIPEFEVIAEETMIDGMPSGLNAALSSVAALASSTYGSEWGPANAIDGVISESSKWASADINPPHTLTLDLGAYYPVTGFVLRQPSAAGEAGHFNATDFSFQSARSLSGPWFTEARVLTSGGEDFEARTFVAPKDLRYVRLQVDDPGIDKIARVPEYEVLRFIGVLPLGADFDEDGDIDLDDFAHLQVCMSGTGTTQTDPACGNADFDEDGDVDRGELSAFQACMSGANIPADPACAD